MPKKIKAIKLTLISIVLLVFCMGAFFIWANDYYHAEDIVFNIMNSDTSIETVDNLTIIAPNVQSDVGIIFYPGAKVEAISYLPLLQKLKNQGYTCVLVKMPLNMAIFDANAADEVFDQLPDIKSWYIAGHSMGGAMASNYASKHQHKVEGLLLLGAYIYGDYPPEKSLTIYGTFNSNLEEKINYTENIVKIEGGNHAQFGNYGKQKGDPDATISAEEQQNITVTAIVDFIERKEENR